MEVRVRIAPSPTGYPHIGTIYQAMYDFVFAKKYGGKFIVRIEDTDRSRFVADAEEVIYESLKWFGLEPDEGPQQGGAFGPYRQSERLEIYQKYAQQLTDKSHAYFCFCTKERLEQLRQDQQKAKLPPMYDKKCLFLPKEKIDKSLEDKIPHVIRMNVPKDQIIVVSDSVAGDVEFNSSQIDDQVIIKSDGFPTYHLAVVVDDYLMKITHVFRGSEWLSSTPKHVLLYKFLGWEDVMPKFAHVPVLLNPEGGGKLSKRMGHVSVEYYKKEGFLPEAILNFLANIVWNHPEGKEIFPLEDFGKAFELEPFKIDVKPQGAKFDIQKLEWMNGEYIRNMSDGQLAKKLQDFLVDHPGKEKIAPIVPLVKERIKKLSDFIPLTDFFFEKVEYDIEGFNKVKIEDLKGVLGKVLDKLQGMEKPWVADVFEQTFRRLAEDLNLSASQIFQLIRIAVSGQLVTPPLFESIKILGEAEAISRLKDTTSFLQSN